MVGKDVLHYHITEKLGAGGMGVVWKATDTRLGRDVALKFLPDRAAADAVGLERLVREAKAASALNHPNIVTIFEINSAGDQHFIAMELVRGRALSDLLAGGKAFPAGETVGYMVQFCEGLAKAHEARIVHRDIKPSNIMLTDDGLIKILDFGLAKSFAESSSLDTTHSTAPLTTAGVVMGTVPYMSPEQATGEPAGPRSDVFSTGIVLYEMLAGRRPFDGPSRAAVMEAVIRADPPPLLSAAPNVPEELAEIVHRCLRKAPEARFANAGELAVNLRSFERHSSATQRFRPQTAVPDAPPPGVVSGAWLRRPVVLIGLLAVLLLGGYFALRNQIDTRAGSVTVPASDTLRSAETYLHRYDLTGNIDRAIKALEPAVKRDPRNAALQAALAEAYLLKYSTTKDRAWLQRASESARQAVAANGDLAAAHIAQGKILAENGQREQAVSELQRGLELNPQSSPARVALAKIRYDQGQKTEAGALHEEAVRLAEGDWIPMTWLGVFYYRNARYEAAVDVLRKALDVAPDNVLILRNLGPAHFATGNFGDAAAASQRALQLDDTAGFVWSNLGTARYFQGRFTEAVSAFEWAVKLAENDHLQWGNLGDAYRWASGSRNRAADAYARAIPLARAKIALNLDDTATRSSLALYLVKSGNTAEALSEVAQIERTPSNSPSTIYNTAVVHELARDRGKALDALARAIGGGYGRAEIENEPELRDLRSDLRYTELFRANGGIAR